MVYLGAAPIPYEQNTILNFSICYIRSTCTTVLLIGCSLFYFPITSLSLSLSISSLLLSLSCSLNDPIDFTLSGILSPQVRTKLVLGFKLVFKYSSKCPLVIMLII